MPKKVNSFRYVSGVTRRMVETWIKMAEPRPIPWTPLSKPISECKVALLSSGGIALKDDKPFDQEGERQNPWWGDPSPRIAAIEHPFGQNVGPAGDIETQTAVLRATLKTMEEIRDPGTIAHLPFEWPEHLDDGDLEDPTPIADYLLKHPFQVTKLIRRKIPGEA